MIKYLHNIIINILNMFTKNIEDMSLSWLVKYITETYHEPLRKNLIKLDWLVDSIIKDYITYIINLLQFSSWFIFV
jgi:iron-sulfur cluster repair protein YtfE (RIC family)